MEIKNFADIRAIFFDNITIKQTIFKNTFWLGLGIGVAKFLKLILIMYVARVLGATEYGKFTFALSFISMFLLIADMGLDEIVIREFSREKGREKEFYSVLSLKILLILATLALIFIGSFFITPDITIRKIIWILAFFCVIENFSLIIYCIFQALQRMEYQAWATILEALSVTGAGFFVILNYPSVENLSYAYLFSSLIALIFVLSFFHFKIFPLRISWEKSIWKKFLLMAWPLALASFFGEFYTYTDSVMMGHWKLITETGWYNAAYRIIMITFIPMDLLAASFYPVLSKFFKESKERLQETWSYQMEIMILLAVPIVIGGIALAPRIINFVYGSKFIPSILTLQILILMTGIIFLCTPFQDILIVSNQQKKFFWITSSAGIINVILNLILIPKLSLYGAAITKVITYFLILFLFFEFAKKFTPIKPYNIKFLFSFILAFLSSALMYFVITQPKIYYLNILFSILIGAVVYIITFFILRKILNYFKYHYA